MGLDSSQVSACTSDISVSSCEGVSAVNALKQLQHPASDFMITHFMFPAHNCRLCLCISILVCECAQRGSSLQSVCDFSEDRSVKKSLMNCRSASSSGREI